MTDVSRILSAISAGDPQASEKLLPAVYAELRRLAAEQLGNERPGHTLSATALVHEAYLRLAGPGAEEQAWNSRGHFFSAAATAMRRILVDHARKRLAEKRGSDPEKVELDLAKVASPERHPDLLALDEALSDLERQHPDLAQLVSLRYFTGLTMEQAAEVLGISPRTAYRNWAYAKAWLLEAVSIDVESA